MRSVLFVPLCLAILGPSLSGCSKSTETGVHDPVILPAVNLDAPSSIAIGAALTVNLTLGPGSCTTFDRIVVQRTASEVRLTAWGVFHGALPCVMPQPLVEVFQLQPPFPSRFTVTAVQPEGAGANLSTSVNVQ